MRARIRGEFSYFWTSNKKQRARVLCFYLTTLLTQPLVDGSLTGLLSNKLTGYMKPLH